mgnify:CR=1 FL=1
MSEFILPHDHGEQKHAENLYREVRNVEHFSAVCDIFKQLSDPTRVRLFFILCHSEKCVIQLSECMEMSSPALSHHLRPLRAAGLIVSRREGKEVYYRAADTVEAQLFHKMIEQVLEIACPGK